MLINHAKYTISLSTGVVIGLVGYDTTYDEDAGVISVCAAIKSGLIKRDVDVYLNVDAGSNPGTYT